MHAQLSVQEWLNESNEVHFLIASYLYQGTPEGLITPKKLTAIHRYLFNRIWIGHLQYEARRTIRPHPAHYKLFLKI